MNKNESKYFYTASLMAEALIEILDKKDFEYITVKEICQKAGVNRSTFYLHYETMNDLLEDTKKVVFDKFSSYFNNEKINVENINFNNLNDYILLTPKYLKPYLNFIYDNKKIFKVYLRKNQLLSGKEFFSKWNTDLFKPIMDKFNVDKVYQSFLIDYFCSGIISIISKWVGDDFKMSVDEILDVIMYCLNSSLKNVEEYKK